MPPGAQLGAQNWSVTHVSLSMSSLGQRLGLTLPTEQGIHSRAVGLRVALQGQVPAPWQLQNTGGAMPDPGP